ncbi:MAG: T9SS type A sorting domain-containing protein [bacterium]|nr:T9SS type A sorting domain-containing protein [bacterium]
MSRVKIQSYISVFGLTSSMLIMAIPQVVRAQPDTLWTRTYGGSSEDIGYSVEQTSDGGYIITGYTHSFGAGWCDVWLIKTNSVGDTVWTKTFGKSYDDKGYSVQQTKDDGYIITGSTVYFSGEGAWLIKTNANGDTIWTKIFDGYGSDVGVSVQQTSDGGYIITGYTISYGAGESDIWLIKTDSLGNKLWDKTYGGTYGDHGYSVQQTLDGGYIIAGCTESFGMGNNDVWLIKVGPDIGIEESVKCKMQNVKLDLQNYPNPLTKSTIISYSVLISSLVTLKIYDLSGREVITLINEKQKEGHYSVIWDRKDKYGKNLSGGIYFCYLLEEEFRIMGKMVVF